MPYSVKENLIQTIYPLYLFYKNTGKKDYLIENILKIVINSVPFSEDRIRNYIKLLVSQGFLILNDPTFTITDKLIEYGKVKDLENNPEFDKTKEDNKEKPKKYGFFKY